MSELKAMHAFDVYEEYTKTGDDDAAQVYLKSEADRVIAELKKANNDKDDWCLNTLKENRHQKYKRCLAMAEWCEATALWCYQAANTLPAGFHATLYGKRVMIEPNRLFKRWALLTKWHKCWLELAEQFCYNKAVPFKEGLIRHFKAVKGTGCNCLFCRNLNREPK